MLSEKIKLNIADRLTEQSIRQLIESYKALLDKNPFPQVINQNYPAVLSKLKRERFRIGPYEGITIFEAANRIASDLTLLQGVSKLFSDQIISSSAQVQVLLGTMQGENNGDFTIFENGSELQGEAFDVAPTFFKSKLYKTLVKWRDKVGLRFVVFNEDCLEDQGCKTYLEGQKQEHPSLQFIGVRSWHL